MSPGNPAETGGYAVIIEWDGQTPPTTWYSRLHRYGLWVRGTKEKTPLIRREANAGVVVQEGALVVTNLAFARLLAATAVDLGAKVVTISHHEPVTYHMSREDALAYERITQQTSRRGPKSKTNEGPYTITCLDEALTYEAELRDTPVICPNCGSYHVQWRRGKNNPMSSTLRKPLRGEGWIQARFGTGFFEITKVDRNAKATPISKASRSKLDQAALTEAIRIGQLFQDDVIAIRAMDIAYCLVVLDIERAIRIQHRAEALSEYYAGGGQTTYSMNPKKTLDLVDIAGVDPNYVKFL